MLRRPFANLNETFVELYIDAFAASLLLGVLGSVIASVILQCLAETRALAAVVFYFTTFGGTSLVAINLIARRRTLGALAQSERRYRSLFEQNHVAICEMDFSRLERRLRMLRGAGMISVEVYCR